MYFRSTECKKTQGLSKLTNCLRGIRNAWHFQHAVSFVIQGPCMLLTHFLFDFRNKILRNRLN
ncbi:DUF3265 domain-containing protein [Vibrio aestuarianus]|nr:hypothetical protein [Vibrio aestuarianus]MDE1311657.1 DUF3265 domain-containing protein [Vibrio aestuarianus]